MAGGRTAGAGAAASAAPRRARAELPEEGIEEDDDVPLAEDPEGADAEGIAAAVRAVLEDPEAPWGADFGRLDLDLFDDAVATCML